MQPTYSEIASNWELWQEYVDPGAEGTEAEFDAMTSDERRALIVACFGEEQDDTDTGEAAEVPEVTE